ncbi:MAG TPA: radical SAM protein [Noviherbaspirillum sp.]|nr:radical SAM protein [Noviherbaspirillum sp.]
MELILYPTEQCNFRCTYCYEDFLLGKMSRETIDGIKRLISHRAPDIKHLNMSWFGGEPLAAKDVVYEIAEHAHQECQAKGVHLTGHLTTNGYFVDVETAARLHSLGQSHYQISLDGLGEDHDKTRKLMSGGGTFARIWSNMLALRDSDVGFHINFRIHLTRENLASIERLAHEMRREFLHDSRFTAYTKTIENLGNDAANDLLIPLHERQASYRRIADAFGIAMNDQTADTEAAPTSPQICYAARPNSLAIRANGVIQKCTVLMSDDTNRIGAIKPDGSMDLDRDKMGYWMRGYDSMDLNELKCPAHSSRAESRKTIPIVPVSAS